MQSMFILRLRWNNFKEEDEEEKKNCCELLCRWMDGWMPFSFNHTDIMLAICTHLLLLVFFYDL